MNSPLQFSTCHGVVANGVVVVQKNKAQFQQTGPPSDHQRSAPAARVHGHSFLESQFSLLEEEQRLLHHEVGFA